MSAEAMKWARAQLPALTMGQQSLLQWLAWEHRPGETIKLSVGFIASALGADRSNVHKMISRLGALGLLDAAAVGNRKTMIVLNLNIRLVMDEDGNFAVEKVEGSRVSDGSYERGGENHMRGAENHMDQEFGVVPALSSAPRGVVESTTKCGGEHPQLKKDKKLKGEGAQNSAEFSTPSPAPKEVKSAYPDYTEFDRVERLGPDFNEEINEHNAEQFREYDFALRTELKSRFAAKFKAKHVDDRDVVEAVKDRWAKWDGQRWLQGGGPRA